jgi:hypothetical protein
MSVAFSGQVSLGLQPLDLLYALRCVTQPLVVSIASKQHPVSTCPFVEAKR